MAFQRVEDNSSTAIPKVAKGSFLVLRPSVTKQLPFSLPGAEHPSLPDSCRSKEVQWSKTAGTKLNIKQPSKASAHFVALLELQDKWYLQSANQSTMPSSAWCVQSFQKSSNSSGVLYLFWELLRIFKLKSCQIKNTSTAVRHCRLWRSQDFAHFSKFKTRRTILLHSRCLLFPFLRSSSNHSFSLGNS